MIRVVILLVAVSLPVTAAPPPTETEAAKLKRLWGETSDPDKDCTFSLDGDRLRISMPASVHSIDISGNRKNAPRVLRDAIGDFVMNVKIVKTALPAGFGQDGLAGAGLIISDDEYVATFQRFHTRTVTADGIVGRAECYRFRNNYVDPDRLQNVARVAMSMSDLLPPGMADKPVYLRLTRKGSEFTTATSPDGKTWVPDSKHVLELTSKVRVGVVANHSGNKPYEAEFESLTVTESVKR
jgi:regulation of enolase protein 1 (concanavalin A-like superfamily)